MTSLYLEDFKAGLDLRKSILTAHAGSLQQLDNCVVTPGGEICKRKAFVPVCSLPAGTKGLHGSVTGWGTVCLYAFGFGVSVGTNRVISTAGGFTVYEHFMQQQDPAQVLFDVLEVREYGPQQFFVAGNTSFIPSDPGYILTLGPAVRNWWKGAALTNDPGTPRAGFQPGYAPLVSGQKLYHVWSSNLYFSGVGDPGVSNPFNPAGDGPNVVNPGAGFIDMSRIDSDLTWLLGLEAYYKQVAIFSRRAVVLYNLDPDPAKNTIGQVLRIGAVSNQSIVQFGTGDVLFLSDSGVRSLRALNVSLAAGVTDVGSPIDSLIQDAIRAHPSPELVCKAVVEPTTGRYWLAIGNVIYVLSYWPSAKISAWSTFTLPFNVDAITTAGLSVFVRSGDTIYQYGGADGQVYDNAPATVRTPHLAADTPTIYKKAVSLNAMVQGNWSLSAGMEADRPGYYELAANLTGNTYSLQQHPFAGYGTHIGFKLTCTDAAPSLLGALAVRFQKAEEE